MENDIPNQISSVPQHKPIFHLPLKVLLIILVFILGSIVGVYGYQWYEGQGEVSDVPPVETGLRPVSTPDHDETANWETYRNEEYEFEFRYPNNLAVYDEYFVLLHESPIPNSTNYYCEQDTFQSLEIAETRFENPKINLHLIDTQKDISSVINDCEMNHRAQWERNRDFGDHAFLDAPIDFEGPTVVSRETKQYNLLNVEKVVHLIRPDKTYILYYFYETNGLFVLVADSELERIADQILSTFKFLGGNTNVLLQTCPQEWVEQLSPPESVRLTGLLGSETENFPQQYLVINGEPKKIDNYDIQWIEENCEVNQPEPVG